MNNIIKKIINRNLDTNDYIITNKPPIDLKLSDIVIAYTTGNFRWKIIKLNDLKKYCILYDRFFKKDNDKVETIITLVLNPITLNVCTFVGKITIDSVNDDGSLILKKDLYTFKFGTKHSLDQEIDKIHIKRKETKLMELRNIFIFASDPKFIIVKKKISNILEKEYYFNNKDFNGEIIYEKYHPKTLVYIIQYLSKYGKYKTSIIIGVKSESEYPTGYNYKESKFEEYFIVHRDKIIEKKAFIYPMLLYSAKLIYKNAKIIIL